MFVDIENFKSVVAIENLLIPYKRGMLAPDKKSYFPKETITPDVCFEVLRSTNAPRNIKDMLVCISELPIPEQAQFKDIVLATFTQREQPKDILILAEKLAHVSNYEKELSEAQKLDEGEFLLSQKYCSRGLVSYQNSFAPHALDRFDKLICLSHDKINFQNYSRFPKILEFPNSSEVYFADEYISLNGCNFDGVKKINFKDGARVNLAFAQNLPPQLDVSMCSFIRLANCDLSNQANLRFKDGAEVNLSCAQNLPPQLDFSRCGDVNLWCCDLKEQSSLCFKEGAVINLGFTQNLPACLDVTKCQEVTLSGCDLIGQPSWCFQNTDMVLMVEAKNLPSNLDVSHCMVVNLRKCDLRDQSQLRFKNGANVNLSHCVNFPSRLDVSMCNAIYLSGAYVADVKEIVFKNQQQMKDSDVKIPDNWKGKVIYTDTIFGKFKSLFNQGR